MRLAPLVAATAIVLLAPAAYAGSAGLDAPCYVEGATMTATGSGFTANAGLTLSGDGAFARATADAAGNFSAQLNAPTNPTVSAKASAVKTYTLNVASDLDASQAATVQYQVTNFAFETSGGVKSPRAKRSWFFAGFPVGATIYGHFRHNGRTYANYRFGKAKGPCGTYSRQAPGIPVRHIRSGRWTVQIDTFKRYSSKSRPSLTATTNVFLTYR